MTLVLRCVVVPAVILAHAGNAGIHVFSQRAHSIPVLRRFDKLESSPLSELSPGLEERQLDTTQGGIYNENTINALTPGLFYPVLNSWAWSPVLTLIECIFSMIRGRGTALRLPVRATARAWPLQIEKIRSSKYKKCVIRWIE